MSHSIKFKDLKIGVFVLFNNQYSVKINERQIMNSQKEKIDINETDNLEIDTDCDRILYKISDQ